jgi:hypothetical protein
MSKALRRIRFFFFARPFVTTDDGVVVVVVVDARGPSCAVGFAIMRRAEKRMYELSTQDCFRRVESLSLLCFWVQSLHTHTIHVPGS